MFETTMKTLWTVILFLGAFYIGITILQQYALEARVAALEEAGTSWDITIVRPAAEQNQ